MAIDRLLDIATFLISILCGFIFIPLTLNFCKSKGLYDIPNKRKVHHKLIPRLGGITFIPSMILAALIAIITLDSEPELGSRIPLNLWTILFVFSLLIIYIAGIVDDLFGLSAGVKLVIQIVAAALMPLGGLSINNLHGFCGIYEIPVLAGIVLTIFVFVFITNAINLIDGIDGLAASLSLTALFGLLYGYAQQGLNSYCIIIAGMAGVLIPYLYFNIFGKVENNRKIFMGDSGSLTLGFLLSFLVVKYVMVNGTSMPVDGHRMLLAYSLLIIPIFDVIRVVFHRLHYHTPVFKADKSHIHHKLMRAGCSMHQALGVILALALLYIPFNMWLFTKISLTGVVLIDIVIYTSFNLAVNYKVSKK